MHSADVAAFAGEATLLASQHPPSEWEVVFGGLATPGEEAKHTRALRALALRGEGGDSDFGPLGGGTLLAFELSLARMTSLSSLTICDVKLRGPALQKLLLALGSVPAFAKPHAEVWAGLRVAADPPQGGRLCLMRNGLADADLPRVAVADAADETDARLARLRLGGVIELGLAGNPGLGDAALLWLYDLVPGVRRLHLGGTGVTGGRAPGGALAKLARGWGKTRRERAAAEYAWDASYLARQWPLLEVLSLHGAPLTEVGLRDLQAAFTTRAERAAARPPSGFEDPLHPNSRGLAHLDLRAVPNLSAVVLRALGDRYREFNEAHRKLADSQPWELRQAFAGGRPSKDEKAGLVLRHDFEGKCSTRLCLDLYQGTNGQEERWRDGPRHEPIFIELFELDQASSLGSLLISLTSAANGQSGEAEVRRTLDGAGFPFQKQDTRPGAAQEQTAWECAIVEWTGADGETRDLSGEGARRSKMMGNLLADHRNPRGRLFDREFGPIRRADAKRVVELRLGLRLVPWGKCPVALRLELRVGGGGGEAQRSAPHRASPRLVALETMDRGMAVGKLLDRLCAAANGGAAEEGGEEVEVKREEPAAAGGASRSKKAAGAGAGAGKGGAEDRGKMRLALEKAGFPFASAAEPPASGSASAPAAQEWVVERVAWRGSGGQQREQKEEGRAGRAAGHTCAVLLGHLQPGSELAVHLALLPRGQEGGGARPGSRQGGAAARGPRPGQAAARRARAEAEDADYVPGGREGYDQAGSKRARP